ncbi:MAG: thiamine pyrophosphate-binding protein [Thermoanaerobaculia bacterium]|nr:thiamine pyrophosphate-binding protein [Thermoanaerobaculia bacterium]
MNGGDLIARVLEAHEVRFLFTLCGGHISPILVGAKERGLRVVDTRDEVTAVFAADAVARLTGTPGAVAVTAGPGLTNTVTAVKNAQMAHSPLVILGGATATVLEGRGALQDIDQRALMQPHVKWATSVRRVKDLPGAVTEAFAIAADGVPGPVFVECPVDLLYDEETVREWYSAKGKPGENAGLGARLLSWYLRWHTFRLFAGSDGVEIPSPREPSIDLPSTRAVKKAARKVAEARRPVLLVGSQALLEAREVDELVHAVEHLNLPVYLSGSARGLLGADHPLQMRHRRGRALKEADLVLLAGVVMDFRLDYGRQISRKACLVSANRSDEDLYKNRRPDLAVLADPGRFLRLLAQAIPGRDRWEDWRKILRGRDREREDSMEETAGEETDHVNPLRLCQQIESRLPEDSILVVDGGDFVATASYIVQPRRPLSWLDPGPFGTLGVGAGFALGAKLVRPEAEVWLLYGDGSAGYSLAELDTFRRHGLPVIAVIGNDASWQQIARDQGEILGDLVGTELAPTDYHRVAEGYGGRGFLVDRPEAVASTLQAAREAAGDGDPVLVNARIGTTDFRKGSISI